MKTIQGKGGANPQGDLWLAIVPDDATSAQDPRGAKIVAPPPLDGNEQARWLEGVAFAIRHIHENGEPRA